MKNDDDDENNDKNEDIKNGLLDDFNDLISFGFSENPFKAPNLSIDRRLKTVFWFRPTVLCPVNNHKMSSLSLMSGL